MKENFSPGFRWPASLTYSKSILWDTTLSWEVDWIASPKVNCLLEWFVAALWLLLEALLARLPLYHRPTHTSIQLVPRSREKHLKSICGLSLYISPIVSVVRYIAMQCIGRGALLAGRPGTCDWIIPLLLYLPLFVCLFICLIAYYIFPCLFVCLFVW